jgi:hypothetical protein
LNDFEHLVLRLFGMAEVDVVAAVAHVGTNLIND